MVAEEPAYFAVDANTGSVEEEQVVEAVAEVVEEVKVKVRDLESSNEYEVTVIAVLDEFLDNGPVLPSGIFISQQFLFEKTGINSDATRYFFRVEDGYTDPSAEIESGLFEHAIQTLDLEETLIEIQSQQRSFFALLTGFMLKVLVVFMALSRYYE